MAETGSIRLTRPPKGEDVGVVVIRPIDVQDWREWRELRRAALAEAPHAFRSTLADWTGKGDTEARWRSRLEGAPLNLVADLDGRPVGMVSAIAPDSDRIELISMWVASDARGHGVGDALVEAVVAWGSERGAARVTLEVAEHNHAAVGLYARQGFSDAGSTAVPDDPLPTRLMVRDLGAPGAS